MTHESTLTAVAGELSHQGMLRRGGEVGITEDFGALVIVRDGEPIRVSIEDIVEVTVRDFDWYLALLGLGVTGFGLLSLERSVPLGVAFTAVGLVSLGLTYRKREQMNIRVTGRTDPLTLYPVDPDTLYEELEVALQQQE